MREEAGREQIAEFGFQLGNSGSAYDYGICSHYYRVRKTDLRHSESQCCDAQESNPISHRDGRLHHRTGASWRVFAFDQLGGRWVGLLYIGEFLVVSFYIHVPTRGWMDARLPIMLLAGALMLFLSGSGKASVDSVMRNLRQKPSR